MTLVSGKPPILIAEANRLGRSPALYLSSLSIKERHTSLPKIVCWHRRRHESFGGCTTFTALLGVGGGDQNYKPVTTSIRRTIGHVLDYSIRPSPASNSAKHSSTVLSIDSRLDPSDFGHEILYRTSLYANGWRTRLLTLEEIGLSFGLPTWLRGSNLEECHLPVAPIQIINGCLNGLFTNDFILNESLPTPLVRPPRTYSLRAWLPDLKRCLPHSWMSATLPTSAKALKSDDAGIPTHLWDQHILLVLPWVAPFLVFLRRHLLFKILRNLFLEFKDFMDRTHGKNWSSKLYLATGVGRKEREQGGQKEKHQEKEGKPASSEITELLRDAEVGVSILQNFGEADWCTWSGESTLIFWRWSEGPQRRAARDGMAPWISRELPHFKRKSNTPPPEERRSIWPKIETFLQLRYVRLKKRSGASPNTSVSQRAMIFESSLMGQVVCSTEYRGPQTFGCLRQDQQLEFSTSVIKW
jgi:hypothetical protein